MKIKLLLIFALILSFKSYSQIVFEKGYIIDNNDNKIDCLIENIDWNNNPTEIQYKLNEQGENSLANIQNIKGFGIYNESKYERFNIDIDRSSSELREMKFENYPVFKKEILFLRVIVEGKATLYEYIDGNLVRYFYKIDQNPVQQLVFKTYKIQQDQVGINNQFRQQLWANLQCAEIGIVEVEKLKYKAEELTNFFTKYNKCQNSNLTIYHDQTKKDLFNLNIRTGITNSNLTISNQSPFNFSNRIGFRLGLEAEFILPFNKNKWAILFEPTYHSFSTGNTLETEKAKIIYNTIELPVGFRYYMFVNDKSKFFANTQYVIMQAVNSTLHFEGNKYKNSERQILPNSSLFFGAGYNFRGKYSAELRMNFKKNILDNYFSDSSTYRSFSLVLGYTLI
ncbi:porin family protein [Flavobacterium ustbae]|uniref:tRNA modification GTPase n=1 Tax=Flavobacterium ustbae TaxID=2488790 RepID=UPI000F7B3252|nr:tRNA modification GTPase [Flavobacterium ustbae]